MTREEICKELESITVGLDDTFQFHCTQCGKCCIHRSDIMLSPRDIYRMSKELKLSPSEFFRKYCCMIIGADSRIPIVLLRPVGEDERCPLLKNNKCAVHKVKPTVCGMFPLGRYIAIDPKDYGKTKLEHSAVKYLLQPPECVNTSQTHTVREWLGNFDISLEDRAFLLWNQAISEISLRLQTLEKKWDALTMMEIWFISRVALYENYTTDQEFLPQFENNTAGLKTLLEDIPRLKEMMRRAGRS